MSAVPNSQAARLERESLRRARILDALAIAQRTENDRHIGAILAEVGRASATDRIAFEQVGEELIDGAVSLALAPDADENGTLSTLAMASRVLAADGQFARLSQLAQRFDAMSTRFAVERPYLSAFLKSLALSFRGRDGRGPLQMALGLAGGHGEVRQRSDQQVADVAIATCLYRLQTGSDVKLAADLRRWLLDVGDGGSLVLLDLLTTWAAATARADLAVNVTRAAHEFGGGKLAAFLRDLRSDTLFPGQLRAIEAGALAGGSRVIALPTSSGKTLLAQLRIARELVESPGCRCLYVAPYRVLGRQVERELKRPLARIGFTVKDLGGAFNPWLESPDTALGGAGGLDADVDVEALAVAELPDVAVLTPERLDALFRLSRSDRAGGGTAKTLLETTKLLVFDELQLIGRAGRGPRFELLIARIRDVFPDLAILGLSAASQGVEGIARWIGDEAPVVGGRRPTGTVEVLWQPDGRLIQRGGGVIHRLDWKRTAVASAAELVLRFKEDYMPVLVVETTRPMAESVASQIRAFDPQEGDRWRATLTPERRDQLDRVVEQVRSTLGAQHRLAGLLREGVAYHHAGVPAYLLREIEHLARIRALRVAVATTTVAEGADLPFRIVVLPHLNFEGPQRRLQLDVYQNIIGRAGRAGVAVEGIVFLLGSTAPSLKNYVERVLWGTDVSPPARGRLGDIAYNTETFGGWAAIRDVESQLLAWIGEGGGGIEEQSRTLGEKTFTWTTSGDAGRDRVLSLLDTAAENLNSHGLIRAASPYRITKLGERARLAGLSARSCVRLNELIATAEFEWINQLIAEPQLDQEAARALTWVLLSVEETLEQSLWLRRISPDEKVRYEVFRATAEGRRPWPVGEPIFEVDAALLSGWVLGTALAELGRQAPYFNDRGLFGSLDDSERASDAADLLSRMSYPAAWCWSALRAMMGNRGDDLPRWAGRAVELGVPTESAVEFVLTMGMSREGAVVVSQQLGSRWADARDKLHDWTSGDARSVGLTASDVDRLFRA